tara:strand:+ start:7161 stop:7556 length:396 start_codon:yes stop_codon:yes gene_type:complete
MASLLTEGGFIKKIMSNKLSIFSNQITDGDSIKFFVSPREGVGISDTQNSAYFEIFGSLGGGTLSLQKKCIDGAYREEVEGTQAINSGFPAAGKVLVKALNYKDQDNWKFVLAGATNASLTVTGINMQTGI